MQDIDDVVTIALIQALRRRGWVAITMTDAIYIQQNIITDAKDLYAGIIDDATTEPGILPPIAIKMGDMIERAERISEDLPTDPPHPSEIAAIRQALHEAVDDADNPHATCARCSATLPMREDGRDMAQRLALRCDSCHRRAAMREADHER